MKNAVQDLVKLLLEKQLTLALAESVTCGLVTHQLSTVKGTSEILEGSIVCYSEKVKNQLLGVSKNLLKKYSAESQQATDALAKHLRKLISADIHVSITGLTTPGASENKQKPVGTIFISVLYLNRLHKRRKVFRGTPLEIKKKGCEEIYRFIIEIVKIQNGMK
jgi:PncC family amidohydrolase